MSAMQPGACGQKQVAEKQIQEVCPMSHFIRLLQFVLSLTASSIYPRHLTHPLIFHLPSFVTFYKLHRPLCVVRSSYPAVHVVEKSPTITSCNIKS